MSKKPLLLILLAIFLIQTNQAQDFSSNTNYLSVLDTAISKLHAGNISGSEELFHLISNNADEVNNDRILANAYNSLAVIHSLRNRQDSMILYSNKIMALNEIPPKILCDTYTRFGNLVRFELNDDSALYYFKKSYELGMQITPMDSALMVSNLLETGSSFLNLNMGDSAITYNLKALKFIGTNKYSSSRSYTYSRIAEMYIAVYNLERAEEFAVKSMEVASNISFTEPKIKAHIIKARIKYLQGEYQEAIDQLNLAKETNSNKKNRIGTKIAIPFLQSKLELNKEFSEEEMRELMTLKKETQASYDKARINLIILHAESRNFSETEFITSWNKLWTELNADSKLYHAKELHLLKYKFFKDRGIWEKALTSREHLEKTKEDLSLEQQHYAIYELASQYKKVEQDNQIALLDAKNEIQSIKIHNKNKLIWAGAIGLGLISLLALFLFKSRRTIALQKDEISFSLNEKDTLLREIHHRVKNNLQVISSLLRLQSNTTEDEGAIEALKEGQSRVQSMSLIHQNLYQKENLTGIKVNDYLEKLCNNLFATYDISKDRISLETEIQDLNLDVDSVVPLGLIINELITNSLKYAFPEERTGTIRIALIETDGKLKLTVQDNGIGIGSMAEMGVTNSFGYRMINSFARKLDAELKISSEDGTKVEMIISDYELS